MVAFPTITNPLEDLMISADSQEIQINLLNNFDDPFTTGLIATFDLFNPKETFPNDGIAEVVLFDQTGEGAPGTVDNFSNYVEDGDYVNSIIHRSVPNFVVQGGGFTLDEESFTIEPVPTDDPIVNEFSSDRSNVEGTIAMAKLGGDPDSATSQWFFNLGDNSEELDIQNGGFTVFGELISEADAAVVDAIAALPIFDLTQDLGEIFSTVPIDTDDPDNEIIDSVDDFVRYESITISEQEELTFTITNNSNPELVEVSLEGDTLSVNPLVNQAGVSEITVQATNLVGETVEDTLTVEVTPNPSIVELTVTPTDGSEADQTTFTLSAIASQAVIGEQIVSLDLSGDVEEEDFSGTFPDTITIADGETIGKVEVSVNDDDLFEAEETATFSISNPSSGIILGETVESSVTLTDNDSDNDVNPSPAGDRVFRFFNTETGGHFYTTSVAEREFVRNQAPEFQFEGVAFVAAQPEDENATPVFRFFNTVEGEHFYTASVVEQEFVEDQLPDFQFEGVAFFAYEEELAETVPVFRFFDSGEGGHFYTASAAERDFVEANLPSFNFEDTAFFANPISEGFG